MINKLRYLGAYVNVVSGSSTHVTIRVSRRHQRQQWAINSFDIIFCLPSFLPFPICITKDLAVSHHVCRAAASLSDSPFYSGSVATTSVTHLLPCLPKPPCSNRSVIKFKDPCPIHSALTKSRQRLGDRLG